jgi:uncharacterized membrane protein
MHWPNGLGAKDSVRRREHDVPRSPHSVDRNVGRNERELSLAAGGALVALGILGPRQARALSFLIGVGLVYRGITGHCHLYDALGINTARGDAPGVPARQGFKYEQAIAIQRSPADLYREWRDLSSLPKIMRHVDSVASLGERRSEWVACGPMNIRLRWEAEIIEDRENELIAWQSLPGGDVETAGSVHFRPLGDGRGTAIQLSLKYNPPGGKVTAGLAWLLGQGAETRINEDLRRFKSVMEAGEAPTTEGQPRGPRPQTSDSDR